MLGRAASTATSTVSKFKIYILTFFWILKQNGPKAPALLHGAYLSDLV